MFRTSWIAALAVLAAGCAAGGPDPQQQAREETKQEAIADILSQPLPAEEYASEERCLSIRRYSNVDILDDQHVVFHGPGDRIWINKLRSRCVGLRRDHILQFDVRNMRVCELDSFEGMSAGMWGMRTGFCTLGTFSAVTPEQLEAIETAVAEARKR